MRIVFEKADDVWYAVAYDQELNDYVHQELIYAEISESLGAHKIVWEDAYFEPEFFDTFDLARKHVLANYSRHQPLSQGRKTYVGE
jgi:hypothetical protein